VPLLKEKVSCVLVAILMLVVMSCWVQY